MIGDAQALHSAMLRARLQRLMLCSFTMALTAAAVIEPMIAATSDSFNPVRQGVFLVMLNGAMLLGRSRLLLTRELYLYSAFTAFMIVSLGWAPSATDGANTIFPAIDFILLLILFASLATFYELKWVLRGALGGFLLGALVYTATSGFPFGYPDDFSYNAIAGMYLLGLFITLVFGWHARHKLVPLLLSLIVMLHIAATTFIKTNLGIALGAVAAGVVYSGKLLRMLRKNLLLLVVLVAALIAAIVSNERLLETVQGGLDRVSRGAQILERREDVSGDTSFGDRTEWQRQGIKGWIRSPILGNGVEAFRSDVGITSHSTPIDLLYNTGIIGFSLFYALFASLALRLAKLRGENLGNLPPLIFAGLTCYGFITISGTMHYNSFMAVFFGVSIGLLRRRDLRRPAAAAAPLEVRS